MYIYIHIHTHINRSQIWSFGSRKRSCMHQSPYIYVHTHIHSYVHTYTHSRQNRSTRLHVLHIQALCAHTHTYKYTYIHTYIQDLRSTRQHRKHNGSASLRKFLSYTQIRSDQSSAAKQPILCQYFTYEIVLCHRCKEPARRGVRILFPVW